MVPFRHLTLYPLNIFLLLLSTPETKWFSFDTLCWPLPSRLNLYGLSQNQMLVRQFNSAGEDRMTNLFLPSVHGQLPEEWSPSCLKA